jgi:hypothetical protein
MLGAFVDESGSPGRQGPFVMTAIIAPCEVWADFAADWDKVLKESPAVPYYHKADFDIPEWLRLNHISKPEAEEKTERLSQLIKYPPVLFSVECSVEKDLFREIITDGGLVKKLAKNLEGLWLKTPYNYCFHEIIRQTVSVVARLQPWETVNFIFDRNVPLFDAANRMLRELRKSWEGGRWDTVLGEAIPGNVDKVCPLQAADMVAGRVKDYLMSPTPKTELLRSLVIGPDTSSHHPHAINRSDLERLADRIRKGSRALLEPKGAKPQPLGEHE